MKNFFTKFASAYVWGNVMAVLIVIALLCIGVKYGLDYYTRHGESIAVPNIVHMQFNDAEDKLDSLGLEIVVTDTGYIKSLPPDCILDQSPVPGKRVKGGRVIYVTINSAGSPTLVLPDVIDNGSFREASAQLMAMGFKLGEPEYIPGEPDWIYGIKVNGKPVRAGQRIPVDARLVIVVGDGTRSISDSALFNNDQVQFEEVEEEEPEYEYEVIEVQVDEDGNEITPSAPSSSSTPAQPAPSSTTPAQ